MNILLKKVLHTVLFISFLQVCYTQKKFGNEWIDPSKTYFKIKVAENGIYKVSFEELVAAGWNFGVIPSRDLLLINFGKEEALSVSAPDFGPGAFFEFYGEKNTIGLDSLLYEDWNKDLFNPEYSLVNDTNAYFLTVSPNTTNQKYTIYNPDFNNNSLSPFPYYLHEEKLVFHNSFFKNVDGDIRYSHFEPSEGFGDALQQTTTSIIDASLFVEEGPAPVLSFRLGQNNHLSKLEVSWNNVIKELRVSTPKLTSQFQYILDKSEIKSKNTLGLKNVNSANDRHRLAYYSLIYPRNFDFGNNTAFTFTLPESSGKRFFEVNSFKENNQPVFLFDIDNKIRYSTKSTGGKVQSIVNPVQKATRYILVNQVDGVQKASNIIKIQPNSFLNKGDDYIIISNKALYSEGPDFVKEFADYRSSEAGGSYKTTIIDIQEIYDHFAYGIDRHFVGLKNLSNYLKQNWPEAKFVLFIGKGIEYPYMRTKNDVINNENKVFFIPTFGYPGSDNMLLSEGNFPDPNFAVGRIAARTPDDIKAYLNKVKEYELASFSPQTIEDKYWMKRVLHLGGGNTNFEQAAIKNGLLSMESILENSLMGADISTYYKTSTDILQSATSSEIKNTINKGVNIITFFGHSGVGTFDFSLESPGEYTNFKKYPLINSLGCYSGNIHTIQKGISESFVFEKDKGAIAFLASSGTAFISALSNYAIEFYDKIGNTSYGEELGLINKSMANKYRYESFSNLAFYQQQTFHGDPALTLYNNSGPDYIFDYNSVKTIPSLITSNTKEFELSFDIVNIGKAISDSLELRFEYQLPSGLFFDTIYSKVLAPVSRSTYRIKLKNAGVDAIGKNTIFGAIDPLHKVEEKPDPDSKNNNKLEYESQSGFKFYILDNTAFPVFPDPYAIVNNKSITLQASASNAFIEKINFIFEIDTTILFNSPLMKKEIIAAKGGLIGWKLPFDLEQNRVYYWRVSPDSLDPEIGYLWQNSSFIFIPGSATGWNQSHYFQLRDNNGYNQINVNEDRKFIFPPSELFVQMRNGFYQEEVIGYRLNLGIRYTSVRPWLFTTGGAVSFVIQDPDLASNALPGGIKINNGGDFGSVYSSEHATRRNFTFYTRTPEERKNVIDFMTNVIPEGSYVTFFTVLNNQADDIYANEWENDTQIFGKNIISLLESEGAQNIRNLAENGTKPYIFMYQKGKRPIAEKVASDPTEIIESQMSIPLKGNEGILKTVEIKNASKWEKVVYKLSEKETTDTVSMKIIGIDQNNIEKVLFDNILVPELDLSQIDAAIYPSLKIHLIMKDVVKNNVPQVEYLRVFYNEMIDVAIDPSSFFIFNKDSVDQGELFKMAVCVRNLSTLNTDSIDVKYYVIDLKDNKEIYKNQVYRKINPLDTLNISFSLNTVDISSEYLLVTEVNPQKRFAEKYYFNNIGKRAFKVKKDMKNPLMDIYFDNIQIMDGDIVSSKPEIKIIVNDDNQYLSINDPNLLEVKLDTGRNQLVVIPMNSPEIKFIPADQNNKTAKLFYSPTLKEGEYKLIVQASDASGNKSGLNPRIINFRVVEKQSISNVLNYPNPFSTSTQFVFTLTGNEVPDILSITIMTISGKVVREISKNELGPLHVGVNRTEYKWDGTDEYGVRLSNGVYLYKVNTRKTNGEVYDNFNNTKTDVFFNQGFGKMVIMR